MPNQTLNKSELFLAMDETVAQIQDVMAPLDESDINEVPFSNSWTAAMVLNHVTKSIHGIAKALLAPPNPTERNIDARVPELKEIFLNFSTKFNSPDFILPDEKIYSKQDSLEQLQQSFVQLKQNVKDENFQDLLTGLPFGDITKLESLHFILYHTQRHLHQLKRISTALAKK